jgi:protein-disulfide isomerase
MSQTKRELRAERRAVREAAERAAATAATKRRRLWRLAAVSGVALIAVAIAVAVSASGGSPKRVPTNNAANLVAGIPEHNGVLGNQDAPVTITEYLDPQCPICAEASKQTLPPLIDDYVRTGKVKLQARTLHFIGPDSTRAAEFAAGAREQGRLWAFMESFYAAQGPENSGYVTDGFLRDVAKSAGVDADQAFAFAKTSAARAALERADADAAAVGANSTPTFTIKRGNGKESILAVGPVDLRPELDKALAG